MFKKDLAENILCLTLIRPVSTLIVLLFSTGAVSDHKQALTEASVTGREE